MCVASAAALCSLYLLLGTATQPAAAAPPTQPPLIVPALVQPELFEGFQPIPPDDFGLSPGLNFFVFQDDEGLHVVRLQDAVEVFNERIPELIDVGFDPGDHRLYILDGDFNHPRFRFINLFTGETLLEERLTDQAEVRTDLHGFVNLLVTRSGQRSDILVFDGFGRRVQRLTRDALATWGV
ncbi:MAG TPA: hypothetical protein VFU47_03130, partial [Armatimonadota bacterium]|nr:hypothetical protein [Armatimonadota bacterium]